jgi:hypothetical protein
MKSTVRRIKVNTTTGWQEVRAFGTESPQLFVTPSLRGYRRRNGRVCPRYWKDCFTVTHLPTGLKMTSLPLTREMAFHAAELLIKSGISWETLGSEDAGRFRSPLCLTVTDDWEVVVTLRQQLPNGSLELAQARCPVCNAMLAAPGGTGFPSKRGFYPGTTQHEPETGG